MELNEMTRTDAIKALMREKARNVATAARESGVTQRAMDVGTHALTAAIAVAVPAWFCNRDPEMTYVDEEKTIETEAVIAGGLLLIGVTSFIATGGKPKYRKVAQHALTAGIASGSSYLGHAVRTRAQRELAEEQALAAQTAGGNPPRA